jgi:hypothetical protein
MNHLTNSLLASTLFASTVFAQIAPGNLVVVRVGTGAATLTSASTAAFLDQYTSAGSLVNTNALPITPSGSNQALTVSGSATSEGFVTQSVDGRFLTMTGYNTAPGTAAVAGTTSATVNRVIARIDLTSNIDTTTALADGYTGSNIRSAITDDGSAFWIAGTSGTANFGGMRYATFGATTSMQLTVTNNTRVVSIYAGQLYCSSASGALQGIGTVGVGTPTTSGQAITVLPGFPITAGPSNYDFFFADANTLYVADDRTTGLGGIQKWVQAAGTWTLQYTLAVTATSGCRGLSGFVQNGVATLFATTTQSSANTLVAVTDTGAGSLFAVLATAATNTAYRGVRWVRTPATIAHGGTGCATSVGIPTIGTNGQPVTGNLAFQVTSSNNPPLSIVLHALNAGPSTAPVGFPIPGAPACAVLYVSPLVLLAELIDPLGNAFSAVPIPANASLGGFQLSAQAFPFDVTLVGFSLPIGSSDALDITIGN